MVIAQAVNPARPIRSRCTRATRTATSPSASRSRAAARARCASADDNPYTLYSKLVGLTTTTGGGTDATDPIAAELLDQRKSVNDLVRASSTSLMGMSALSAADKQRLQQHFDAIRDAEVTMGNMGGACTKDGLSTSRARSAARAAWPSRPTA